jgi:hypothetical protein
MLLKIKSMIKFCYFYLDLRHICFVTRGKHYVDHLDITLTRQHQLIRPVDADKLQTVGP